MKKGIISLLGVALISCAAPVKYIEKPSDEIGGLFSHYNERASFVDSSIRYENNNSSLSDSKLAGILPSVEMLVEKAYFEDSLGEKIEFESSCSATTIAEDEQFHYLLTAKHCVTMPKEYATFFGTFKRISEPRFEIRGIKDLSYISVVTGFEDADYALLKTPQSDFLVAMDAPIGNSDVIEAGDYLYTIGFPLGLDKVVSDGIIGAPRLPTEVEGEYNYNGFLFSSPISGGNSGCGSWGVYRGELHFLGITSATYPRGQNLNVGYRGLDIVRDMEKRGLRLRLQLAVEG